MKQQCLAPHAANRNISGAADVLNMKLDLYKQQRKNSKRIINNGSRYMYSYRSPPYAI